jgi:hypothetical protein
MKYLATFLAFVCIPVICHAQFPYEDESSGKQTKLSFLALHKRNTLNKIGLFKFEQRVSIHESLTELSKQLMRSKQRKILKSVRSKDPKDRSLTIMIDRDGDNKADIVVGGDASTYIYDLNKDGNIDYVVFFLEMGSLGLTKGNKKVIMNFFHWIDSNYDGKIDILVYPSIDLDGDGFQDEGLYAWLYDSNGDGRIDKAEHVGPDIQQSIDADNGVFKIKSLNMKEIDIGNAEALKDFSGILTDINSMINE